MMYHEIHNEPEKEEVFQFMIEWLDKHRPCLAQEPKQSIVKNPLTLS